MRSLLSYVHSGGPIPLMAATIGERLAAAAERRPDSQFLSFSEQSIRKSFAQTYTDSFNFASGLLALGAKRGDRIGIWSPNRYEWILTQMGAALSGLVLVNLNPSLQPEEMKFALRKSAVRFLVSPVECQRADYFGGVWNFEDIMQSGESSDRRRLSEIIPKVEFDDPAAILYSSGTTGEPKAITLSHHSIVNNANFCGITMGYDRGKHSICIPNPLFHCFGSVVGVVSALLHSQLCVFPSSFFDSSATIRSLENERCTTLYGTPTMFLDILNDPLLEDADISNTHSALIAGSPIPPVLLDRLRLRTQIRNPIIGYGCTEMTTAISLSDPNSAFDERKSNVGVLTPHLEMAILNDKGEIVERGESGEIAMRGYSAMLGYWEGSSLRSHSGWFLTGDIGKLDEQNRLSIVGRSKEMIIRGGENIFPTEVEHFLCTHPLVESVQVVGVPDERMGEELCAVIQTKSTILSETDIREFCRHRIAHFKVPRYILFRDSQFLPMTESGKVKKAELSKKCVKAIRKTEFPMELEVRLCSM